MRGRQVYVEEVMITWRIKMPFLSSSPREGDVKPLLDDDRDLSAASSWMGLMQTLAKAGNAAVDGSVASTNEVGDVDEGDATTPPRPWIVVVDEEEEGHN